MNRATPIADEVIPIASRDTAHVLAQRYLDGTLVASDLHCGHH